MGFGAVRPLPFPSLDPASASDHGVDAVAVPFGVRQALQEEDRRSLAHDEPVGALVVRSGPGGGEGSELAELHEWERPHVAVDPAGDGDVEVAVDQALHRRVHRRERGGASRVDGEVRAVEVEQVRHPAGQDVAELSQDRVSGDIAGDARPHRHWRPRGSPSEPRAAAPGARASGQAPPPTPDRGPGGRSGTAGPRPGRCPGSPRSARYRADAPGTRNRREPHACRRSPTSASPPWSRRRRVGSEDASRADPTPTRLRAPTRRSWYRSCRAPRDRDRSRDRDPSAPSGPR